MSHLRRLLALFVMLIVGPAGASPTSLADLAHPPPDARRFTIMSTAGPHGQSWMWRASDGTLMGRESLNLRGQVSETDSAARRGADGMLARVTVRGFTPTGDASETFEVDHGRARWRSAVDAGSALYRAPALYNSFGGTAALNATFLETLLKAPGHSLALLPGGRAHADRLARLILHRGGADRTITAWSITGLLNEPFPIWSDDKGRFFAQVGDLSWMPAGYEADQPRLQKAQDEALARRSPALARALLHRPAGPVAFVHVRAFVDGDHFAEDQTVVVNNGDIAQVGPTTQTTLPAGARIIDGRGQTLVPGLWDAHMHVSDDFTGPLLLSLGVTSVRDPGNVTALTLARAARRARGDLLLPHVYPSMLIDGQGPNSAQVGQIAKSRAEALSIVRQAKADGFDAIKIYGSFDSSWLADTTSEAHRLGLHVHGHLPAGMRTSQAIGAGYDEITHIYFVMMQAMPDAVVSASNGIARFEGPGRYARQVDIQAEPMKSLIAEMAEKHIAVDPTLVVAEGLYVPENGDLSPAYAPFVGTLPPALEREFRTGGLIVPPDLTRADYRASFTRLSDLVEALHKAGVPIVAGTDGTGLELVRELELYVAAGFTPAEALASATIATARLVGAADRTGSISVGKTADLVLVDGDPSRNIGDLRHTRTVMMDGQLMDADALRAAGGFAGRPKFAD